LLLDLCLNKFILNNGESVVVDISLFENVFLLRIVEM